MSKSSSTITPKGSIVLFRQIDPEQVKGVHLPERYAGQRAKLLVEAVGPEVENCKPGDFILVSPSGRGQLTAADPEDEQLILIDDEHVVATVVYAEPSLITMPAGALA